MADSLPFYGQKGVCFECGGQWHWSRNAYDHRPGCSRGQPLFYSEAEQDEHMARAAQDYGTRVVSDGSCPHGFYPAMECPTCELAAEYRIQGAGFGL